MASDRQLLIQCVHNAIWIARNPAVRKIDPHVIPAAREPELVALLERLMAHGK